MPATGLEPQERDTQVAFSGRCQRHLPRFVSFGQAVDDSTRKGRLWEPFGLQSSQLSGVCSLVQDSRQLTRRVSEVNPPRRTESAPPNLTELFARAISTEALPVAAVDTRLGRANFALLRLTSALQLRCAKLHSTVLANQLRCRLEYGPTSDNVAIGSSCVIGNSAELRQPQAHLASVPVGPRGAPTSGTSCPSTVLGTAPDCKAWQR